MRFVDAIRARLGAHPGVCLALGTAAWALSLGGCAMLPSPPEAHAPVTPSATAASTPSTAAVAQPPVAAVAAPAVMPVSAAAQRTFDDAVRLIRANRHEEALAPLQQLAREHPALGGVHANLGLIHLRAGRAADAVSALEAAVAVPVPQTSSFNLLGIARREAGQFAKAREAYLRAIELAPDDAQPVLNLAILEDLYLGDATRALELYTRYLTLTPQGDANVAKWVADLKNRGGKRVAQQEPARKTAKEPS